MLRVDKGNYHNTSRARGYQKSTDFMARNKRAVRERQNGQESARSASRGGAKPPPQRVTARRAQAKPSDHHDNTTANSNGDQTVVISKRYLDELLRMSIVAQPQTQLAGHSAPTSHVVVNHGQIPGLNQPTATFTETHYHAGSAQNQEGRHAEYIGTRHQEINHAGEEVVNLIGRGVSNPPLSKHEQWLQDIAVQAEEQKRQKEAARQRRKQASPEEYYPWGRPGGGAPIRTESGELMADYRKRGWGGEGEGRGGGGGERRREREPQEYGHSHSANNPPSHLSPRHAPPAPSNASPSKVAENPGEGGGGNPYSTTPRFARGAGPHVNQYVLRERDVQREKEMEHKAFLAEQIAAKERAKMEERERRAQEEREAEERLERDRAQLQGEYRREKERARRKEEEAAKLYSQLQQRIAEAEENARRDRESTRRNKTLGHPNTRHQAIHTVRFTEPEEDYLDETTNSPSPSPRHIHISKRAQPHANGRSTLQRSANRHKENSDSHSSSESSLDGRAKGVQTRGQKVKSAQQQGGNGRARATSMAYGGGNRKNETPRKPSRIPVRVNSIRKPQRASQAPNAVQNQPKPTARPTRRQSIQRADATPSHVRPQRVDATPSHVRPPSFRSDSPPVPALAKKLGRTPLHEATNTSFTNHPPDTNTMPFRTDSPPVPALSRKQQATKATSGNSRDHPHTTIQSNLEPYRSSSPPVPALAKKLQAVRSASEDEAMISNQNNTPPSTYTAVSHPPASAHHGEARRPSQCLPINRPPSCAPTNTPVTSGNHAGHSRVRQKAVESNLQYSMTAQSQAAQRAADSNTEDHLHLPPIAPSTSTLQFPPPHTLSGRVSRQHMLMQELAFLRQGIISQRLTLDERVDQILSKKHTGIL